MIRNNAIISKKQHQTKLRALSVSAARERHPDLVILEDESQAVAVPAGAEAVASLYVKRVSTIVPAEHQLVGVAHVLTGGGVKLVSLLDLVQLHLVEEDVVAVLPGRVLHRQRHLVVQQGAVVS